jgi:hypothetical protein
MKTGGKDILAARSEIDSLMFSVSLLSRQHQVPDWADLGA